MNINNIFYYAKYYNLKTIYFNFKYFPFFIAIKLPVFVSRYVILKKMSGKVHLPQFPVKGMIKIGYGEVGIFDKKKSRTIWEVAGNINFQGKTFIGHGSKICVGKNGNLITGNNFIITAETSIVAFHKVVIGHDCLFSWDNLIIDTDFHKIVDYEGKFLNADREIKIGDKVWLSARCTVIKGSNIPSGCVIAANSLVTGVLFDEASLYGGNPAILKKKGISWSI